MAARTDDTITNELNDLGESALRSWTQGRLFEKRPISPGHSGASVWKVDIRGRAPSSQQVQSGQYFLKSSLYPKWEEQEDERTAHDRAVSFNSEFAKKHIPSIAAFYDGRADHRNGYALLLEVAGGSTDTYGNAAGRANSFFDAICPKLIRELLVSWSDKDVTPESMTSSDILRAWLGYRLEKDKAPDTHAFIAQTFPNGPLGLLGGEAVLNPLSLLQQLDQHPPAPRSVLKGILHGDMHGENIFVHSLKPTEPFWIIDFGLSHIGPLGFDQAYIEVTQTLYNLSEQDPVVLLNVLRAAETNDGRRIPIPEADWLLRCLIKMRAEVSAWIQKYHPRRTDDLERQFLLSRVAAGFNWANKPIPNAQRILALAYSAYAARLYAERREPSLWARVAGKPIADQLQRDSAGADKLWDELLQLALDFNIRDANYILIADAQREDPNLAALGHLPWGLVIDLDPYSDDSGLLHAAGPVLNSRRGLHVVSRDENLGDFIGGTKWLMSCGWVLKNDQPSSIQDWKYKRLQIIRSLAKNFAEAAGQKRTIVVALTGASLEHEVHNARLRLTVDAVDEMFQGQATIIVCGAKEPGGLTVAQTSISLEPQEISARLTKIYGSGVVSFEVAIPSSGATHRMVSIETLRTMQENFEVLHGNILDLAFEEDSDAQAFWTGRPANWKEINAGADISRNLAVRLRNELVAELKEFRNRTIVLTQHPGAGGTTLARRVAWDLHLDYPVAMLSHYSEALPDRLQSFYQAAETPILLVAEASKLTESAREDLHRELSRRNVRCVLLYVRKVFPSRERVNELEIDGEVEKSSFQLLDPMGNDESEKFLQAFRKLTTEDYRLAELARITYDEGYAKYRSPFFYGLVTFEREFSKIDEYVATHLHRVRGKARDILEYVAIVTIFSNSGIPRPLVNKMLNLSTASLLSLEEMLGDGPARLLTVRDGCIRFMHQVIAEQVIQRLSNSNEDTWRAELRDISIDFIRDCVAGAGANSVSLAQLFRELFTERQGSSEDRVEDRRDFSPLIEELHSVDKSHAQTVLQTLTDSMPGEAHFWSHRGRYLIYRVPLADSQKAEEFLQQAIRLSPDDPLHHHTYGLVKRSRIRQLLNQHATVTVKQLLDQIAQLFDEAARSFSKSRELEPEGLHGYITHTQMILEVALKLKQLSHADNVADLSSDASSWVSRHMSEAFRLLEDAETLYGTLANESRYISQCRTMLTRLFGNLDDVIRIWELHHASGKATAYGRRALALAYVERRDRVWRNLEESELRTVRDLVEANLSLPSRTDEDYRLWFEASRHLPEFYLDDVISRLMTWAKRTPSWRPYYYIYVLRFLQWFHGETDSIAEYEQALDQCKKLFVGRRNASFLWLSQTPSYCPLVSASDLGGWDKQNNFWKQPALLERVLGVTDEKPLRPQSGNLVIGHAATAFFVPGREFIAHEHENKAVNCFLGFGIEGLRAWDVRLGHERGIERTQLGKRPQRIAVVVSQTDKPTDVAKEKRAKEIKAERLLTFAEDYLTARHDMGVETTLSELEVRLDSVFGVPSAAMAVTGFDLATLLDDSSRFIKTPSTSGVCVELVSSRVAKKDRLSGRVETYSSARGFGFVQTESGNSYWFGDSSIGRGLRSSIGKGALVSFVLAKRDGQEVAESLISSPMNSGTNRKENVLDPAAFRIRTGKEAEVLVREYMTESQPTMPLGVLASKLKRKFIGNGTLLERLGCQSFSEFVRGTDGLEVCGEFPNLDVRLRSQAAMGRLPIRRAAVASKSTVELAPKALKVVSPTSSRKKAEQRGAPSIRDTKVEISSSKPPQRKLPTIADATKIVCDYVTKREKLNKQVYGAEIGSALTEVYGNRSSIHFQLNYKSLESFLRSISQITVTREGNNILVSSNKATTENKGLYEQRQSTGEPDILEVEKFLLTLVDEVASSGRVLDCPLAGERLREHFKGTKPVHKRLGSATLTKLISKMKSMEIRAIDGKESIVRRTN